MVRLRCILTEIFCQTQKFSIFVLRFYMEMCKISVQFNFCHFGDLFCFLNIWISRGFFTKKAYVVHVDFYSRAGPYRDKHRGSATTFSQSAAGILKRVRLIGCWRIRKVNKSFEFWKLKENRISNFNHSKFRCFWVDLNLHYHFKFTRKG